LRENVLLRIRIAAEMARHDRVCAEAQAANRRPPEGYNRRPLSAEDIITGFPAIREVLRDNPLPQVGEATAEIQREAMAAAAARSRTTAQRPALTSPVEAIPWEQTPERNRAAEQPQERFTVRPATRDEIHDLPAPATGMNSRLVETIGPMDSNGLDIALDLPTLPDLTSVGDALETCIQGRKNKAKQIWDLANAAGVDLNAGNDFDLMEYMASEYGYTPADYGKLTDLQILEMIERSLRRKVRETQQTPAALSVQPVETTGQKADLDNEKRTTAPVEAKAEAATHAIRPDYKLSDSEQMILNLCRRKAMKGECIAAHPTVALSNDHTRRLLARLVKEGRLINNGDGYRTV
jgi:hypothetical protein